MCRPDRPYYYPSSAQPPVQGVERQERLARDATDRARRQAAAAPGALVGQHLGGGLVQGLQRQDHTRPGPHVAAPGRARGPTLPHPHPVGIGPAARPMGRCRGREALGQALLQQCRLQAPRAVGADNLAPWFVMVGRRWLVMGRARQAVPGLGTAATQQAGAVVQSHRCCWEMSMSMAALHLHTSPCASAAFHLEHPRAPLWQERGPPHPRTRAVVQLCSKPVGAPAPRCSCQAPWAQLHAIERHDAGTPWFDAAAGWEVLGWVTLACGCRSSLPLLNPPANSSRTACELGCTPSASGAR